MMPDLLPRVRVGALGGLLLVAPRLAPAQKADPAALAVQERSASEASARDGFAPALLASLAPGGALLWPGAPVVIGADQARRLLGAQRLLDSLHVTWQPLGLELASDGTLGVTWGVAAAARDGAAARIGRYIAAWRPEGAEGEPGAVGGVV